MEIPYDFRLVEAGLYSARSAPSFSFPFIKTLGLKTIILLDPAAPSKSLMGLVTDENINIVHLVPESWRSSFEASQQIKTWIVFSEALKYTLDQRNYPLMIIGSDMLHAVIRRLQNWTISAVLNEFNAYSELSDVRVNSGGSRYLEMLRLFYGKIEHAKEIIEQTSQTLPNLPIMVVDVPEEKHRPEWVRRFNVGEC